MEMPLDSIVTLILFPLVYTPLAAPREVKLIVLKRPGWTFLAVGVPFILSFVVCIIGYFVSRRFSEAADMLWPIVILVLLLIDLAIVLIMSNQFATHDGIIKLLLVEAKSRWMKTGRLSSNAINDLIDLGKKTDSSQTKDLILENLYYLLGEICTYHEFSGDNLDGVMFKVVDILVTNNSGNPETYIKPIQLLQSIANLSRDRNSINTIDLEHTIRAISLLSGVILVKPELKLYAEDLLAKYCTSLEYVADIYPILISRVGDALYEIGIQSARKEMYVPARLAVGKLIILYSRNQDEHLFANVLGLFAFLWCAGNSVRRSILNEYEYFSRNHKKPMSRAFDTAVNYFTVIMQFETAEKLTEMASDVHRKKK